MEHSEAMKIANRLSAIRNGSDFGERDIFSINSLYPYELLEILSYETGEILVRDLSLKHPQPFTTNVMLVDIEKIDFIKE